MKDYQIKKPHLANRFHLLSLPVADEEATELKDDVDLGFAEAMSPNLAATESTPAAFNIEEVKENEGSGSEYDTEEEADPNPSSVDKMETLIARIQRLKGIRQMVSSEEQGASENRTEDDVVKQSSTPKVIKRENEEVKPGEDVSVLGTDEEFESKEDKAIDDCPVIEDDADIVDNLPFPLNLSGDEVVLEEDVKEDIGSVPNQVPGSSHVKSIPDLAVAEDMEIKGVGVAGETVEKGIFACDLEEKFGEDLGETTYPSGKDYFAKGAIQGMIEFSTVVGEAVEKGKDEEDPGSGTVFEPEGEDSIDERAVSSAKDSSICGVVPLVGSEETDSDSEEEVTSEEVDSAAEEDKVSPDLGALMEKVEEADVEEIVEDNEACFKEKNGSAEEKQRIPLVSEANLSESTKVSVLPCAQNVYVVDGLSPGSKDGYRKIQVGEKDGSSSHAHKVFDDLPQQVFMTITPFPVAASSKPSAGKGGANLDEAVTEDEEVEKEGEVTEVVSEEAVMRNKKEISGILLPQSHAVLGEDNSVFASYPDVVNVVGDWKLKNWYGDKKKQAEGFANAIKPAQVGPSNLSIPVQAEAKSWARVVASNGLPKPSFGGLRLNHRSGTG
ncbi:hypothetical protein U1Q18_044436, partial [Sarracenia purpurea var. burkii]